MTVGWNAYMLFPFILVFLTIWQTECPERERESSRLRIAFYDPATEVV